MKTGRPLLALIIIALAFLCTCHNEEIPPAATGEESPLVIGMPHFLSPAKSPGVDAAFTMARTNLPGTPFEVRSYVGNSQRVKQKMLLEASGDNAPDILVVKSSWLADFQTAGIGHAVSSPPGDPVGQWVPPFASLQETPGKWNAIPFDADVRVLWYRKDLFEEAGVLLPHPGWTVEEFMDAARKLSVDLNHDGKTDRFGVGIPLSQAPRNAMAMLPLLFNMGVNPRGTGGQSSSKAAEKTIELLQALHQDGIIPSSLLSSDPSVVFQGLAGGLYAMSFGGSWEYAMFQKQSSHADHIAATSYPTIAGAMPHTVCDGWVFLHLSQEKARYKKSVNLSMFLSGPEAQNAKWKAGRLLSVHMDVYNQAEFETNPTYKIFAQTLEHASGSNTSSYVNAKVQSAIMLAIQSAILDRTDPAIAWKRVEEQLAQQL